MKIRQGFVSNSSTSSFCIIGVTDDGLAQELLAADLGVAQIDEKIFEQFSHGMLEIPKRKGKRSSILSYYGSYQGFIEVAGVQAEDLLETMTLPQAREHVRKLIQEKLHIEVPLDSITLLYGEAGDG